MTYPIQRFITMSDSNTIKLKLKELLENKDSNYVLQLYGKWGVGKTYLWNEVINGLDNHYKKKVVKVSLFDKNSIEELKEDILIQISFMNNTLKKYSKQIDTIQNLATKALSGVTVTSLSSLLKTKDFKDITISFDDIERRNKKFDFDTFLGYVSLLKEDKKCNVVLLLNYDKLSKKDKQIFNKYKEKIIDYNFILQKNSTEAFNDALSESSESTIFEEELKNIVQSASIENIRIIKHMIKMLKEIDTIKFENYSPYIVKSFINVYISYSFLHYKFGINNINELLQYKSYKFQKAFNIDSTEEIPSNEDYDKILKYEDFIKNIYSLDSHIHNVLNEIMKSHFLSEKNKTTIEKRLTELSEEESLMISVSKVNELILHYRTDIFNNIDFYYSDILSEITLHNEKIVMKMGVDTFFFIIDTIIIKDSTKVKELEEVCIEYYLKWVVEYEQKNFPFDTDLYGKTPIDYVKDRDKKIGSQYIQLLDELRKKKLPKISSKLIIETLQKFNDNKYLNIDKTIIDTVKEDDILSCMKENPNYAKIIFFFIRDNQNNDDYDLFFKKAVNVIKSIYDEDDKEINEKIEKIFHKENYEKTMNIINPS